MELLDGALKKNSWFDYVLSLEQRRCLVHSISNFAEPYPHPVMTPEDPPEPLSSVWPTWTATTRMKHKESESAVPHDCNLNKCAQVEKSIDDPTSGSLVSPSHPPSLSHPSTSMGNGMDVNDVPIYFQEFLCPHILDEFVFYQC